MIEVSVFMNGERVFKPGREGTMRSNGKFKSLDKKLLVEAFLRSALWGIAVGAIVAFVCAFVCWLFAFRGLIVSIAVFVVGAAAAGFLFYVGCFRPSVKSN